MFRKNQVERQLAQVPLFNRLSIDEVRGISRLLARIRRPAGETLTREGEPGHEFMLVLEGSVQVLREGHSEVTLGPGSYLGEIALLESGAVRTATAVTTAPSLIGYLSRDDFTSLLAESPELATQIERVMEERRGHDRQDFG
jgi:CRP-like cAMP-binding protein